MFIPFQVAYANNIRVCIAGLVIVGVSTTFDNTSPNMTWNLAPIIIWATVEVNLVTISSKLHSFYLQNTFLTTFSLPPHDPTSLHLHLHLHQPNLISWLRLQQLWSIIRPKSSQEIDPPLHPSERRIKLHAPACRRRRRRKRFHFI